MCYIPLQDQPLFFQYVAFSYVPNSMLDFLKLLTCNLPMHRIFFIIILQQGGLNSGSFPYWASVPPLKYKILHMRSFFPFMYVREFWIPLNWSYR